jgi:NaMN:DMB phosphoribosyltransferase
MTEAQALEAIGVGLKVVADEADRGLDVVCLGDMGIANTSAASATRPVARVEGANE